MLELAKAAVKIVVDKNQLNKELDSAMKAIKARLKDIRIRIKVECDYTSAVASGRKAGQAAGRAASQAMRGEMIRSGPIVGGGPTRSGPVTGAMSIYRAGPRATSAYNMQLGASGVRGQVRQPLRLGYSPWVKPTPMDSAYFEELKARRAAYNAKWVQSRTVNVNGAPPRQSVYTGGGPVGGAMIPYSPYQSNQPFVAQGTGRIRPGGAYGQGNWANMTPGQQAIFNQYGQPAGTGGRGGRGGGGGFFRGGGFGFRNTFGSMGPLGRFGGGAAFALAPGLTTAFAFGGPSGAAGYGAATSGVAAMKEYSSFESAFTNTKSVQRQAGASPAQLEQLEDTARKLGRTTIFSATEVAQGMTILSQKGFAAIEVMQQIPNVLNLAAAAEIDMAEAAGIVGSAQKQFGMEANETLKIVDLLTKASLDSSADIHSLGVSLSYVGAQSKLAGKDLQETLALLMMLQDAGLPASTAGAGSSIIIQRLSDKKYQEMFKKIGVDVLDGRGNIRNFGDIIGETNAALKGKTDPEKADIAGDIFGFRGGRAFAAALGQGEGKFDSNMQRLADAVGTTAGIVEDKSKTMDAHWERLNSAISDLQISFGDSVGGSVKSAVKGLTGALEFIADNTPGKLLRKVHGITPEAEAKAFDQSVPLDWQEQNLKQHRDKLVMRAKLPFGLRDMGGPQGFADKMKAVQQRLFQVRAQRTQAAAGAGALGIIPAAVQGIGRNLGLIDQVPGLAGQAMGIMNGFKPKPPVNPLGGLMGAGIRGMGMGRRLAQNLGIMGVPGAQPEAAEAARNRGAGLGLAGIGAAMASPLLMPFGMSALPFMQGQAKPDSGFQSRSFSGVRDMASSIQSSVLSRGPNDPGQQTAKNTKKIADNTGKLLGLFGNNNGANFQ